LKRAAALVAGVGAPETYPAPSPERFTGRYGTGPGPRGGLRWAFVAIGATILALGAVLILVAFDPPAFGLGYRSVFPFGGGILGAILILWGTLLLVRVAARSGGRRYAYGGQPGRRFDPAILAARQRYARGEITREQFQQVVTDLRGPPRGPLP